MQKLKNILSFAAIICGLLICFNAPVSAQNFLPPGSYQQTCQGMKTYGPNLEVSCGIGGGTGINTAPYSFPDYFECDGEIANIKGGLTCNRNLDSARMLKWRAAIDDAHRSATGAKTSGYERQKYFLRDLFGEGVAPLFYRGGTFQEIYPTVEAFIKKWLSKPRNAAIKAEVIEKAFKAVYNYGANPQDLAFYNAQNIGYSDVVRAETAKLNSKPFVRRVMIVAAYKKTLGRAPSPIEFAYWEPKTEIFTQIVDANRAYLYTPAGASLLAETVKLALGNKMSGHPTSAQIKDAIVKYTFKKTIFDEM